MKRVGTCLPWHNSSPSQSIDLLRLLTFIFVGIALLFALFAPVRQDVRLDILGITFGGFVYAILLWTPWLSGKRTLVDAVPFLTSVTNVILISFVVMLFYNETPVIAILYLLAITGIAIRRGLLVTLWTALLSSLGYLAVLVFLGLLDTEFENAILLIVTFLSAGLFTGLLAQTAQKRLREFENVVTQSRDGIVIFDGAGRIEFINTALLTLSGYAMGEVAQHSFFEFMADSGDLGKTRGLWNLLQNHRVPNRPFGFRLRAKDGTERILSATLTRFGSAPSRYMAVVRDITLLEFERRAHVRRDQELDAERQVALAVSSSFDLNRVLQLVLDQAIATLQADGGAIYLADDAQTELALAISRQLPDEFIKKVQHYRLGEGIPGRCAEQKQTIIVSNLEEEPQACQVLRKLGVLSQISVPLLVQDTLVGVLNLSGLRARQFAESDAALLRAIASTVAVAIDRARLFESLEKHIQARTTELAALYRIARASNQSLNLDNILIAMLREMTQTLNALGGWVSLFEDGTSVLVQSAQYGIPDSIIHELRQQKSDERLSSDMALIGQAYAMNLAESNRSPATNAMWNYGIRSVCGVPLIAAGQTVGILELASDQKDRFGDSELRWLTTVGNTIASAIRNAKLYASVEQKVIQLATLREIDHTLNSTLDLEPMLEIMLSSIAQIVPHEQAIVYVLEGTKIRAVAAFGIPVTLWANYGFEMSGNLAFEEMTRERKPIIIGDLNPDALHWSKIPGIEETHSWLGTPLIARDAIIGQISLYSVKRNAFTSEQAEWMFSFASHAAVTVANALLRAELNKQARRDSLTQVLNHSTFIEELRNAYAHAVDQHQSLALIMLDLDNFKSYNDTYGHIVGDQVLTAMVQAIRAHVHPTDLVGRWGGEEFGVAILGASTPHVMQIAKRIRQTLAATNIRNRHGELIPPPTASQGIASLGDIVRDADDLIEFADRALYLAKNQGRDQAIYANDLLWVTR